MGRLFLTAGKIKIKQGSFEDTGKELSGRAETHEETTTLGRLVFRRFLYFAASSQLFPKPCDVNRHSQILCVRGALGRGERMSDAEVRRWYREGGQQSRR